LQNSELLSVVIPQ